MQVPGAHLVAVELRAVGADQINALDAASFEGVAQAEEASDGGVRLRREREGAVAVHVIERGGPHAGLTVVEISAGNRVEHLLVCESK